VDQIEIVGVEFRDVEQRLIDNARTVGADGVDPLAHEHDLVLRRRRECRRRERDGEEREPARHWMPPRRMVA
jgi:hypothetical protein